MRIFNILLFISSFRPTYHPNISTRSEFKPISKFKEGDQLFGDFSQTYTSPNHCDTFPRNGTCSQNNTQHQNICQKISNTHNVWEVKVPKTVWFFLYLKHLLNLFINIFQIHWNHYKRLFLIILILKKMNVV